MMSSQVTLELSLSVFVEAMEIVCPSPFSDRTLSYISGLYSAPCYYYPNRAGGSGRPSFVVAVDLKSGERPSEHWVKRGTALLMSLDF